MFTRASVHCADKIVATSNSQAFLWCSAHSASGYVASSRRKISAIRSGARSSSIFTPADFPLDFDLTFACFALTFFAIIPAFYPIKRRGPKPTPFLNPHLTPIHPASLPQPVQHLFRRHPDARKDRSIFERVYADFRLAQLLHQVQKILREIRLEGHHELLVVDPEGVRRIQLHPRIH